MEQSTAASRRIESTSPNSHFGVAHHSLFQNDEESADTEDGPGDGTEDSGGDSGGGGFIPTPPPYRPPIYTEAMRSSRFRNGGPRKGLPSSKFLDDPSSSSSKYPSMMPQIAKVLLESQSAMGHGATPRPRKMVPKNRAPTPERSHSPTLSSTSTTGAARPAPEPQHLKREPTEILPLNRPESLRQIFSVVRTMRASRPDREERLEDRLLLQEAGNNSSTITTANLRPP